MDLFLSYHRPRLHRYGSLLLIMLLVSAFWAAPCQARFATVVSIEPAVVQLHLNATTTFSVKITGGVDVYGFDIRIQYDPAKISILSVNSGTFLDDGFTLVNRISPANGTIQFAMTQLNPSLPKHGDGILLVIGLRGEQISTSNLIITSALLAANDGRSLPADVGGGSVIVLSPVTPAPSATITITPSSTLTQTQPSYLTATRQPSLTLSPIFSFTNTVTPNNTSATRITPSVTTITSVPSRTNVVSSPNTSPTNFLPATNPVSGTGLTPQNTTAKTTASNQQGDQPLFDLTFWLLFFLLLIISIGFVFAILGNIERKKSRKINKLD